MAMRQRRAIVIELEGVSADAFEVVLEWLYRGERRRRALLPALPTRVRLELATLQMAAARALEDNPSATTCPVA